MMKSIRTLVRQDREKYVIPRRVQDVIPIQKIWEDGIFLTGGRYAKTFRFTDINYQVASEPDKEKMFRGYSALINSLDCGATTKITIFNHKMSQINFEKSILMPMQWDGLDDYREEYNQMLLDKATNGNGIVQEKFWTVSVRKKDVDAARSFFARVEADLSSHFAALGSTCGPMNAMERLQILHRFYRRGEENEFRFSLRDSARKGHSFRDYICPDSNWQRRQNSNNNFSAVVPYDMELQRKESKEFLDDLTSRDQRMMFAVITMVITADTKEQLDADTETILSTARKHMCQMAVLKYQQLDGLNTVLPIGSRKINAFRTLTTESLAVFIPFKVQEIRDPGGIYFGENAISHNLILCNKENLLNQSAFVLGVPGSGKSFSVKELIAFLILNTDDDILICDPEGEYAPLVEAMGNLGSVIRVSAGGKDRLNAMYMVDGYGENNPIVVKSEFVMSLIEQIDKKGVGPQHKSIIDRCIAAVYRNAAEAGTPPTLCTLREMLLEQPEPEAKQIALSLELYTTGSLDIFGHQSNADLDKRVVVFDIHGLGAQLKPTGLLVITDTMLNRVTLNWKKGKRTHVFIDEFHVVFENEFSAQFFNSAWRQFRKRNAYPTAITQNVEYLLDSVQASTMLSNSEFIVMLNQAASDRNQLAKLLSISNEQMSYITNADPGCGLIKYGGSLVPFVNRFPKDTKLYQLMTTKPGEGFFAGQVS